MSLARERHGRILVLTIDRPAARNAVDGEVAAGIERGLDEAEDDDDLRAVVITATGDRVFSAGADLKAVAAGQAERLQTERGGFAGLVRRRFPKVLIAAVNGAALGGGFEIALACDMIVAAETATFGLPEAHRGLFAGAGGVVRLPRRIPLPVAVEIGTTGAPIDARRAYELGLVNRVVAPERVHDEALGLACSVAESGPEAVRTTLALMRGAADADETAWNANDEAAERLLGSTEMMEGVLAFAEKRDPSWR